MSFETDVHCDGCGETIYISRIVPKWLITEKARSEGWSIGKYHLCPECKKKRRQLRNEGWLN